VVARLVDARTGALINASVFEVADGTIRFSEALAEFLLSCRSNARASAGPAYLAVGIFEDLGSNDRQADLPARLRADLTLASQTWNLTLLERECVSILLQEVRLDLAGLTERTETGAPAQFLPAFWLVDGHYQSYEKATSQVELVVNVRRIFGRTKSFTLEAPSVEALLSMVRASVESVLQGKHESVMIPSRMSEVRAQLLTGRQLIHPDGRADLVVDFRANLDEQELRRKRRNLEEAMRAFETVLLLDPGNREAMLSLGHCLRQEAIGRPDEGRELYRKVLEQNVSDSWTQVASNALRLWFMPYEWDTAATWFAEAATQTSNTNLMAFYREQATEAAIRARVRTGADQTDPEFLKRLEDRLSAEIESTMRVFQGKGGNFRHDLGTYELARAYGTNTAGAANHLAALYPHLKTKFPMAAPYLLVAVVEHQVDTNAPVIAEFERTVDEFEQHPDLAPQHPEFWEWANALYLWCFKNHRYDLAARLTGNHLETTPHPKDELKIQFAFACLALEQWQKALDIFESFSKRPVLMEHRGPWGSSATPVLTAWEVDYCRQKLGLPPQVDPREFSLGKPLLRWPKSPRLTADSEALWIGTEGELQRVPLHPGGTPPARIPLGTRDEITALTAGSQRVWIGTESSGLVEFDIESKKSLSWTEVDGLLMNSILALELQGELLWIGYGSKSAGGLGYLNTRTGKCTAFPRSLSEGTEELRNRTGYFRAESLTAPTGRPVIAIAFDGLGHAWFQVDDHRLRRYQPDAAAWDGVQNLAVRGALVSNQEQLFASGAYFPGGADVDSDSLLGVTAMTLTTREWRNIALPEGLPPTSVHTLATVGSQLWVGGLGYVARLDWKTDRVTALAYVRARRIEHIHATDASLWVLADNSLYRVDSSNIP
jgi:tetratricopeptide (TPR) repeat protein